MDVFVRTWRALPWRRCAQALFSRPAETIAAGALSGIFASAGFLQYQAQWGSSGPVVRGQAAALLLGMFTGSVIQRRSRASWSLWLALAAMISLILPAWFDQVAHLVFLLPADIASRAGITDVISLCLALLSLGLPVACWTALSCAVLSPALRNDSQDFVSLFAYWGCGASLGLLANTLILGPLVGEELAAIATAALAFGLSYRAWNREKAVPFVEKRPSTSISAPTSISDRGILLLSLIGCGGALALSQRLTNQLIPQTVYIQQAAWAIVIAGCGLGLANGSRLRISSSSAVLLAVAALLINHLGFSAALNFRLWSVSYVTNAILHQTACLALMAAAFAPLSFASGLMLGRLRAHLPVAGAIGLCLGWNLFSELGANLSERGLAVGLFSGGSALALFSLLSTKTWPVRRWQTGLITAGLLAGVLSPMLLPANNPGLPAKLLFSTPTFLAARSGWKTEWLPQLDDSRLIATSAGRQGPITLWKSRGVDLMIREAGVPRASITCRPDISPQPPAEVLQAVFPLVVTNEMRSVLILGASGGVPLATCLGFPVEQITCVEPDAASVDLIRGPIAAERGYDPFADDRVSHDARPVELAVAMCDGDYDVILSSPRLPVLSTAAPQFTQEFYRRVSRKLSPEGLFCQRLEAIDYGPRPMQLVVKSLQAAFRNVIAVEIGIGEYLFLATNSERGLVPKNLPERLENGHVRRLLARSGWDWSTLLTLPAWDHAALAEFAAEGPWRPNTAANCRLALITPREMLRWGPKLQEAQTLLTKPRAVAPNAVAAENGEAVSPVAPPSRRARYLDWLGDQVVSQDVLRRLSEVVAQTRVIHESPDTFWLDYRKVLREEIQQRPRTEIRQVSATDETERVLHREDERRKEYFSALGQASNLSKRNLDAVYALERFFEPFDPLLSLFARQETAELLGVYGHPDPAAELTLRLYVINFAPAGDRSLRNVIAAMDLILKHPDACADPQSRFDTLNGLLQTVRTRWEARSTSQLKSVRLVIQEVDRSIVTVEKTIAVMDELQTQTQVSAADWITRKTVLERMLLRPLRSCRAGLLPRDEANRTTAEAVKEEMKKRSQ